ncbi:MAG: YeeE/YedE family protein, partial [Alphaproteobacteria bacterium]
APFFAARFQIPTRRDLDARLLGGAAVFGIGWGLVGLCPGPALTVLGTGSGHGALFVAAMFAGFFLQRLVTGTGTASPQRGEGLGSGP